MATNAEKGPFALIHSPHDADKPRGGETPQADWTSRSDSLASRLDAHRQTTEAETVRQNAGGMRGAADGLRLASEFVAGVLAGTGIGYLFDRIFSTSPFGLIVFLLFGFVAGVLNVLRSIGKKSSPAGAATQKDATNRENGPSE